MGAVGGAAAVLGSMEALGLIAPAAEHKAPFQPPRASDFTLTGRTNGTTVLILGAGIAGLTAAYELEKAGYRCEILEARDRPGGRNWTVRAGTTETDLAGVTQTATFAQGQHMNAGPARIPQHHTTLDYCRELGIPIEVFANQNADGYYFNEARDDVSGALTGQRIRHRTAKADYFGYVSELLAKAISQGALDAELSADDGERMIEFLRGFGALGPDDRYLGSDRRGYLQPPGAGFQTGVTDVPADLSELLASGLGRYFPFELGWDQAMQMFQPVGGMDRIPRALAEAVVGRIRYGVEVRSVEGRDDGVSVIFAPAGASGGEGTRIDADYCICTIPPMVLRRIPNSFSPELNAELANVQPVPTSKMGLQFRRRFWEEDDRIFGGITNTNLDIGTIWYPSYGYLGRRGILIGYYNYFGDSQTYGALSPDDRVRRAIEQGRKVHGDAYATEFETAFSVDWSKTRYSEGGWVAWGERTGAGGESYRRLLGPEGRVYFAGDHLSYVTAWQHGAFESARKAVTDLHTRVLAG